MRLTGSYDNFSKVGILKYGFVSYPELFETFFGMPMEPHWGSFTKYPRMMNNHDISLTPPPPPPPPPPEYHVFCG